MEQLLEQPKQLTKQKKFSDILRHTKFKQCYGREAELWYNNSNSIPMLEERCALGVLMTESFGVDYHNDDIFIKVKAREKLNRILKQHNIQPYQIAELNDYDRFTFPMIADYLESKGL